MTTRTFIFDVTAPVTGVPQWYANIAQEGVWVDLTISHTLTQVAQPALTLFGSTKNNDVAAVAAWTGACVDPVRGDLLLTATGGHGDGFGNSAYGFRYLANTPGWYCLNEQTPQSVVSSWVATGNGAIQQYPDGRMLPVHGWNRAVFANGKVWITAQDSAVGDYFSFGVWSFDPTTPGISTGPGGTPLPWQSGTPISAGQTRGPWKYWGSLSVLTDGGGGPACYDPWTGLIWTFHANYGAQYFWTVDPTTGAWVAYNTAHDRASFKSMWAVATPNGIVCSCVQGLNEVQVLNRTTKQWTAQPTTGANNWDPMGRFGKTAGYFCEGWGAVYDAQSNAIYAYDIQQLGAKIRKLNLSTWVWSEYTPAGGVTPAATLNTLSLGSYSKFNIVKVNTSGPDRYALLNVCRTDKVYAMRLPTGGL